MDAVEFLRWVVPQGNNYSVFRSIDDANNKIFWPTKNFDSQAALVVYLQNIARKYSRDAYFALASFISPGRPNAQNPAKIQPARVQSNVAALRSLWVDIDCKVDADGYMSKHEALAALSATIDEGICPQPSIVVDSGNGLHVYWCFTDDIHPLDWLPVATGFRDTLISSGLKIDPGITIDSARILRLPDTNNFKDPANPKPVKILGAYATLDWSVVEHFAEAQEPTLAAYHASLSGSSLVEAKDSDFEIGDIGHGTEPFHMEYAVAECGQLGAMLHDGGAGVPEPLWKSMLLVAARCEDGEKYAHLLSKGHADYTPDATNRKFQQQVATLTSGRAGPTSCATFSAARPEICAVCPHYGAVKSPVLLGREAAGLPPGYMTKPDGIYHKVKSKDGEDWEWEKTCDTFMDRVQLYNDPIHGPTLVGEFRAGRRTGQFALPHAKMSAPIGRSIETVNKQGLLIKPQQMKGVQGFMMDWASYLKLKVASAPPAKEIGWNTQRTIFTYRDRTFSSKGENRGIFIDEGGALAAYGTSGSRDAWFKAAKHMLAAPIELQALVLLSFAAPLIAFTGMDGFVFSFRSTNTGLGKSTALRMGASVWGDPLRTHHSMADTPKSVLRKIGLVPHLPAYWDEVRIVGDGRQFEALTKTIFEIAQGHEMARLRSDTTFNTSGHWKTLLGVCTNDSLIDIAGNASTGPEPVLARLLEIDVPEAGLLPHGDAAQALNALTTNYGHIGPEYIAYVAERAQAVTDAIIKVADNFGRNTSGGVQRYWQVAAAAMVVAAHLTSKLGVFPVDPAAINALMLRTMADQATVHVDTMAQMGNNLQTFRDWFLSTQDRWLVTKGAPTGPGNPSRHSTQVLVDPRTFMLFHADLDTGKVRVKSNAVTDWCRQRHVPPIIFRRGLEPTVSKVHVMIGAGSAFSSPQCPCLEFDMDTLGVREAIERQVDRMPSFGKI